VSERAVGDWQSIARRVAAKWRRHSYGEELESTALLATWKHRHESPTLMAIAAESAMIDDLRKWTGGRYANSPGRVGFKMTSPREDIDHYAGETLDLDRPSVSYNLKGRMAFIADGLSVGMTKDEIARHLGVHPSRVSQLLRKLRKLTCED
jgi:DNA-binding transcriptional ArsR family regulator